MTEPGLRAFVKLLQTAFAFRCSKNCDDYIIFDEYTIKFHRVGLIDGLLFRFSLPLSKNRIEQLRLSLPSLKDFFKPLLIVLRLLDNRG